MTKARGELTRKQLADAAGIHPTTIGKIESGDRGLSIQTFFRIYHALEDTPGNQMSLLAGLSSYFWDR